MREAITVIERQLSGINFPEDKEELTPGLINTKKSNLRCTFLVEYPDLESDNAEERIKTLVELISDLHRILDPRTDLGAPENQKFLFNIYLGDCAGKLAETTPSIALNTEAEVLDYYHEFITDIIYKSVYGVYPKGRGNAIHGQSDETTLPPLTEGQLEEIYSTLGRSPEELLFSHADFRNLRERSQSIFNGRMIALSSLALLTGFTLSMNLPKLCNSPIADCAEGLALSEESTHMLNLITSGALGLFATCSAINSFQPKRKFVALSEYDSEAQLVATQRKEHKTPKESFCSRVLRTLEDMCDERSIY